MSDIAFEAGPGNEDVRSWNLIELVLPLSVAVILVKIRPFRRDCRDCLHGDLDPNAKPGRGREIHGVVMPKPCYDVTSTTIPNLWYLAL